MTFIGSKIVQKKLRILNTLPEGVNMPYVKNSWPSGLPRMQNSDSVPIFDAFIAISHQMAF